MEFDSPLVTVAMPIYNAGRYLRMAVNSIVLQTFTDWELLIIDDGSTDNALNDISDIRDSRIRVLRDGHNRGLAVRLNEAIEQARGQYFARMDQDDVSYPQRLERQLELLRGDSTLDLVATRAIRIDEGSEPLGLFPSQDAHEAIVARPWLGFYFLHPSWMGPLLWFRKHRYAQPAPFFCEDQELLLRSYAVSRFGVVPEVLFAYRVRSRFNLAKQFRTRRTLWQVQCRKFLQSGQWGYLLLGTLAFIARVGVDFARQLAWRSGLKEVSSSISPNLSAGWAQIRNQVGG